MDCQFAHSMYRNVIPHIEEGCVVQIVIYQSKRNFGISKSLTKLFSYAFFVVLSAVFVELDVVFAKALKKYKNRYINKNRRHQ